MSPIPVTLLHGTSVEYDLWDNTIEDKIDSIKSSKYASPHYKLHELTGAALDVEYYKQVLVRGTLEDAVYIADNLLSKGEHCYIIPSSIWVVYTRVIMGLMYSCGIVMDESITASNFRSRAVSEVDSDHAAKSVDYICLKYMMSNGDHFRKGEWIIFLIEPRLVLLQIMGTVYRSLSKHTNEDFITESPFCRVVSKESGLELQNLLEAIPNCMEWHSVYDGCLGCPIAETCVSRLAPTHSSEYTTVDVSPKDLRNIEGAVYVLPSLAAIDPGDTDRHLVNHFSGPTDLLGGIGISRTTLNSTLRKYEENTREHLDKLSLMSRARKFTKKCVDCDLKNICTPAMGNKSPSYKDIVSVESACKSAVIDAATLPIQKAVEIVVSSSVHPYLIKSPSYLNGKVQKIAKELADSLNTPLDKQAAKSLRYLFRLRYSTSPSWQNSNALWILPTETLEILERYREDFTITRWASKPIFSSAYEFIHKNLELLPIKKSKWSIIGVTNYFSMAGTYGFPYTAIGCRDFNTLYKVPDLKKKLHLKAIKETLVIALAKLLVPYVVSKDSEMHHQWLSSAYISHRNGAFLPGATNLTNKPLPISKEVFSSPQEFIYSSSLYTGWGHWPSSSPQQAIPIKREIDYLITNYDKVVLALCSDSIVFKKQYEPFIRLIRSYYGN